MEGDGMQNKRLYRSTDRIVFGVCAGLAEYFEIDPTLIRVIFALATIFFAGSGLVAYLVLWLMIPESDAATGSPAPR
jgi:phage shock protein C